MPDICMAMLAFDWHFLLLTIFLFVFIDAQDFEHVLL
jgi:hypothetical protein